MGTNNKVIKISTASEEGKLLPDSFAPTEKDVVCGWARQNQNHAGNKRFRELIDEYAPLYVKATTKLDKSQVIAEVIDRVRNESPDGGFVKKDFYSGHWYEIGNEKARDKVGHAMRKASEQIQKKERGRTIPRKKASKKEKLSGKISLQQDITQDEPISIQSAMMIHQASGVRTDAASGDEFLATQSMLNHHLSLSKLFPLNPARNDFVSPSFASTLFQPSLMIDGHFNMPEIMGSSTRFCQLSSPHLSAMSYFAGILRPN